MGTACNSPRHPQSQLSRPQRRLSHGCKFLSVHALQIGYLLSIPCENSQPHPIFVIVLVGRDEQPFGIQKDFLCDRSSYFRNYFANSNQNTVEHIVKLPEASREVFGLAQHFLFTGQVTSDASKSPSYEDLVGLWKLGHKLDIDGLCDRTLQAMIDCRRLTERIPSTPLLIQVWKETPEGSSIRKLLLSWAAEYMRSSDARAEFAKSLPQEVLSELVVTMSSFDITPLVQAPVAPLPNASTSGPGKNVHYLESRDDDETLGSIKRNRRSSGGASAAPLSLIDSKATLSRKTSRPSLNSAVKPQKRRSSAAFAEGRTFTTSQKLDFCADLLTRMLSGPGKWNMSQKDPNTGTLKDLAS